ncbi:alkaline phosphatase family protein [Alicyclobacillus fastidiosus]|uniref:Alkaline phosphatase family protein n=1 Tax=Alicyclobacillus fastidiosus TaxID=392011 RepID=A0ABY6ZLU8_9BACL|nr:alkaline phosphatase family protein [Alicyclobacillus fastidiosus]WAH42935.1 alkaline phosphatase family protein [Alicyclobacillus fastidiosus]GMA64887.1 hypothetical protein GCM10025859_53270 [Alicyclobacillus fastidiosus]
MAKKLILFGVDGLIPELVYRFAQEGDLPNIRRMLSDGASAELVPFISTWGDVNFVSMVSGQTPGMCWGGQRQPLANDKSLLSIMDKQGSKCALVHFPCSVSTEGTSHFVYAPFGDQTRLVELIPGMIYSTNPEKWPRHEVKENLGWPPQNTVAHHLKANRDGIEITNDGYAFWMHGVNGSSVQVYVDPVDDESVKLRLPNNASFILAVGEWTPWTYIQLGEHVGSVRFKLLAYDPDQRAVDVLQSQTNVQEGISNDPGLEQLLHQQCGPFISKWTVTASPDEPYHETSFEEAEYQATWLADAALNLLNDGDFQLFATVFRLNDETHHTCLGQCDPRSPFYDPECAPRYEQVMRQSYQLLDRAIGKILREKSEDTTLLVVSDHGDAPNSYFCDIYRRLEDCNLTKLDQNGQPILEHSKVYLKNERGGLEVFVNLKGREEQGIVPPEDYESVQTEIFRALTTWYHETPEGPKNVVGLVLRKQDAGMIGYWGSHTGDVIFAYNQGFVWGTNQCDTVAAVSQPGANHGPQIPTASTGYSSNYGIALWYGDGTRSGYVRDRLCYGAYAMNDVGTTISKLLGLSQTLGLDGRFMQDLFI